MKGKKESKKKKTRLDEGEQGKSFFSHLAELLRGTKVSVSSLKRQQSGDRRGSEPSQSLIGDGTWL